MGNTNFNDLKQKFHQSTLLLATLMLIVSLFASVVGNPTPAKADSNPSTIGFKPSCAVVPESSVGLQGGATQIRAGEKFTINSSVDFDAGVVYQDVIQRADGSLYYASYVQLTYSPTVATVINPASARFSINSVSTPLTSGTQPVANGYVLDTTTANVWKVYFPADANALIANPSGSGVPSHTVPTGGEKFVLSIDGNVTPHADVKSGAIFDVAKCGASVSTGPSNKTVQTKLRSIGIAEPQLKITKKAKSSIVTENGDINWNIEVKSPVVDANGFNLSPAQDVVITDVITGGAIPLDPNGDVLVGDGVVGNFAGTGPLYPTGNWSDTTKTITWNIAEINPGSKITLGYKTRVTTPNGTTISNNAKVDYTSLPGSEANEKNYTKTTPIVNVSVGVPAPQITKSVSPSIIPLNGTANFTVTATVPAASVDLFDVAIVDTLPQYFNYENLTSFNCSGCLGSDSGAQLVGPSATPDGETVVGYSLGKLEASATDRVYTWVFTAKLDADGDLPNGAKLIRGQDLKNNVVIGLNVESRLGGIDVNPLALPEYDTKIKASATNTYNVPVIRLEKIADQPSTQIDFPKNGEVTYTFTVHNDGAVAAKDVLVRDDYRSNNNSYLDFISSNLGTATIENNNDRKIDVLITEIAANSSETFTLTFKVRYVTTNADSTITKPMIDTFSLLDFNDVLGNNYIDFIHETPPVTVEIRPAVPLVEVKTRIVSGTQNNKVAYGGNVVTYEIEVKNNGVGTAWDVRLQDNFPSGFKSVGGSCVSTVVTCNSNNGAGWGWFSSDYFDLAPGATATLQYQVTSPATASVNETVSNNINTSWYGAGSSSYHYPENDNFNYSKSASMELELVQPTYSLIKGPKETDGALIVESGTGEYQLTFTNTSLVDIKSAVLTDTLPATLAYDSHLVTKPTQTTVTHSGTAVKPVFTLSDIPAGGTVYIRLKVAQNGTNPDPDLLENTVSAAVTGTAVTTTAKGYLLWAPAIEAPFATKTVNTPDVAPGGQTSFTVDLNIQANLVDLYDVTFIDNLPDGLAYVSTGIPVCVSACSLATPTFVGPTTNGDRTDIGWWLGDVPAGTVETWRVTYIVSVERNLDNGTEVLDQKAGEPFTNGIMGWYNLTDAMATPPANLPATGSDLWYSRGTKATASVNVISPLIKIDKTIPAKQTYHWTMPDGAEKDTYYGQAGEVFNYNLKICNTGSANAFDVVIEDDMANGDLANVVIGALSAGVTLVDGYTVLDPKVIFNISTLALGGCVDIPYTASTATSDNFSPGYGGKNSDAQKILNTATAIEYHTVGVGQPNDLTFNSGTEGIAEVTIFTPIPYGEKSCNKLKNSGTDKWSVKLANGSAPFKSLIPPYSPDVNLGGLYNPVIEIKVPNDVTADPTSFRGRGKYFGTDLTSPYTTVLTPVSTTPGATSTTYRFEFTDTMKYSVNLEYLADIIFDVTYTAPADPNVDEFKSATASLSGNDSSGASVRGTTSGSVYTYLGSTPVCGNKKITINKYPDPARNPYRYYPGDTFDWTGAWALSSEAPADSLSSNVTVTDLMPDGVTYTPGTAKVTLRFADGSSSAELTAGVDFTETITNNPNGTTKIVWTGFPTHRSASYTIPATLNTGRADLINTYLTNNIEMTDPAYPELSNCGSNSAATSCDIASVFMLSQFEIGITKTVDDDSLTNWGTTRTWTVDVKLPANKDHFDLVVDDRVNKPAGSYVYKQFAKTVNPISASCVSGCLPTDPATLQNPTYLGFDLNNSSADNLGWYVGDVPLSTSDRVIRIVYQTTSSEWTTGPGSTWVSSYYTGTERTYENDVRVLTQSTNKAPIAPSTVWYNNFVGNGLYKNPIATAYASKSIQLGVPYVTTSKECIPLNSTNEDVVTSLPGVPNVKCILKVTGQNLPTYGLHFDDVARGTTNNNSKNVEWNLLNVSKPGFINTTITPQANPGDNHVVVFDVDSAQALQPNETWTIELTYRVDASIDWSEEDNDPQLINNFNVYSWSDSPTNVQYIFYKTPQSYNNQTLTSEARFEQSIPRVTSDKGISGLKELYTGTGEDEFYSRREYLRDLARGDSSPSGNFGFQSKNTFYLDVKVSDPRAFQTISVEDSLPYGYKYMPNTARIIKPISTIPVGSATGTNLDVVRDLPNVQDYITIGESPISEPVITPTTVTTACDQTSDFQTGHANGGDTLKWVFNKGGAGEQNIPWDENLVSFTKDQFFNSNYNWDHVVRIAIDVETTKTALDCINPNSYISFFINNLAVNGTKIDGTTLESASDREDYQINPLSISKGPNHGYISDGATGHYNIELQNRPTAYFSSPICGDTWTFSCLDSYVNDPSDYPVDAGRDGAATTGFRDVEVIDVIEDHGFFDATTTPITAKFIPPEGSNFPDQVLVEGVDYTQTVTRIDADHAEIKWLFNYFRSGWITGVNGEPQTDGDIKAIPSKIEIDFPLDIPLNTATGTQMPNTVTANTKDMSTSFIHKGQTEEYVIPREYPVGPANGLLEVINPSAPPELVKTVSTPTSAIGDIIEWDVKANLEPGKVWYDLEISDLLPAGIELISVDPMKCTISGVACAGTDKIPAVRELDSLEGNRRRLSWWVCDVIGSDKSRTLSTHIKARVVKDAGVDWKKDDIVRNDVQAWSNDEDKITGFPVAPVLTGDFTGSTSANSTIAEPDLVLTKTSPTVTPVSAGATIQYEVTITNTGNATAYDIPVTDTPSEALLNVVPTGANASYSTKAWTAADPTMKWFIPSIAPGASVVLAYEGNAILDYAAKGITSVDNVVKASRYDSQQGTNAFEKVYASKEDELSVDLVAPKILVQKYTGTCGTPQTYTVNTGDDIIWCIELENVGSAVSVGVDLTDKLPNKFDYILNSTLVNGVATEPTIATNAQGIQTLYWNDSVIGDILPQQKILVQLTTKVLEGAAYESKNIAVVSSLLPNGDRAEASNTGFASISSSDLQLQSAQLEVTKSANGPLTPIAKTGATVMPWKIIVTNAGTTDLLDVSVKDFLPNPLIFNQSSLATTCMNLVTNSITPGAGNVNVIDWTLDIPKAQNCEITYTSNLPSNSGLSSHDFVNTVEATHPLLSLVANQGVTQTYVPSNVRGSVWKETNGDFTKGASEPRIDGVTVTITGTDTHGGSVTKTVVSDASGNYTFGDLPPGQYFVTFSNLPAGYSQIRPNIGNNDSIDSDAEFGGITQTYTIGSGSNLNNVDLGIQNAALVDISIKKDTVGNIGGLREGGQQTYKITVTNHGPDDATYLQIADALPKGLSFIEASDGGKLIDGKVVWNIDELKNGDSVSFTIKNKIVDIGAIKNIAEIIWINDKDLDPTNDIDEANIQVNIDSAGKRVLNEDGTPIGVIGEIPFTGSNGVTVITFAAIFIALGVALNRRKKQKTFL
jgi:uncharacterized repeat protein (TIGR01451 family)